MEQNMYSHYRKKKVFTIFLSYHINLQLGGHNEVSYVDVQMSSKFTKSSCPLADI